MGIFSLRALACQASLIALLAGCGGGASEAPLPIVANTAEIPATPTPAGPACLFNASSPECQHAGAGLPYVLYTSRSDAAQDAAVNTDIVAVFSEPLDPASVGAGALTVVGDDQVVVPGSVQYDAARNAVVFHQAQDLAGRRYVATVAASVKDQAGNPMGRPFSWSFTVNPARRDSTEQRSVQQILDKAAYVNQIPGAIIAIRDNTGKTWTTTNGYADLATRAPIRADMLFRMGSNTKTYVATLVLQLAEAGKLKLDDPVNKYLGPELAAYLPAYDGDRITVRHLLNHTSGMANFTIDSTWGNAFISSPYQQYFPQELLMIANSHAQDSGAPQYGNFYYSNTNYVLLGLLIRKTSGMAYEDAVANGLTIPQALTQTLVPRIGQATMPPPFSHGYWEDTETGLLHDVTVRDASTVWSSGDMLATIGDLAKWGELLGKGSLLSPAMQAQRLQYVPMTDNLLYGLGIVKDKGANLVGHQGGMIGYTSQMYYVPDKGYTLAFFYNRTLNMHDYSAVMTYDVLRALWPTRPNTAAGAAQRARSVAADPNRIRKPGFLMEY